MQNPTTWRQQVTNVDPRIKVGKDAKEEDSCRFDARPKNNDIQLISFTWCYKWRETNWVLENVK